MSTHAQWVLIRGYVFDYEEKAPFVQSGMSVLGALEWDGDADKVRCHECGDWFSCISHTHLRDKHHIGSLEYKRRHGLNARSGLCTPGFSKMRRQQMIQDPEWKKNRAEVLVAAGREHKRLYGNNLVNRPKKLSEQENVNGRCQAQTLFRIQVLAAELGRTPTEQELRAGKLDHPLLVRHFGSVENALSQAGLNIRPSGKSLKCAEYGRLPNRFPSKEELLNTRMPWPKEYFGAESASSATPLGVLAMPGRVPTRARQGGGADGQ